MTEEGSELPETDFSTLVLSLRHGALMHLGAAAGPGGEQVDRDLLLAQQAIELLVVLQTKTRGNLTGEEERVLDQSIYELRSRYDEARA